MMVLDVRTNRKKEAPIRNEFYTQKRRAMVENKGKKSMYHMLKLKLENC